MRSLSLPRLVLLALCFWAGVPILAFPTFPAQIPNGLRVPCPSFFDATQSQEQCALDICKGVGHVDCRGGDFPDGEGVFLNVFGKAFAEAGRQWTTELCNADSDGDGKTNGQELGDPCCVWKPASLSTVADDYRISHPGHAEDVTDSPGPTPTECKALQASLGAAAAFDQEEWVDSVYNEGEYRSNMTFRISEHTLPTNETIYTRAYFPLKQDEDYYIVGFLADIENKVHVHHFVVRLCTEEFSSLYLNPGKEAGYPENPSNANENGYTPEGCLQNLYNWAPGADVWKLPKDMAIKIGKSTAYKTLFLEIHYNNPDGIEGEMDSSGFTAYATTTPREHEATWFWTGSITNIGDIPPGKEAYFNTAECTVRLRPECEEVYLTWFAPHAHFLGNSIWSEHYRPDKYGGLTYLGDAGRDDEFNYEVQYARPLEQEITIKNGDVIATTCTYDSMDRSEATPGGLASQDEMCVNFMVAYPASCLYSNYCDSFGRVVSGDVPTTASKPYTSPDLHPVGGSPNYTAVASDGQIACDAEAVYANSLVSATGDSSERLYAAFSESCPGLLNVGTEEEDKEDMTPQKAFAYDCSDVCVGWLINFGVCGATDLKAEYEQMVEDAGPFSLGDVSVLAPPSCHDKVAKKLTEDAGSTFSRAQAVDMKTKDAIVTAAAGASQACAFVVGAAIGTLMLLMM